MIAALPRKAAPEPEPESDELADDPGDRTLMAGAGALLQGARDRENAPASDEIGSKTSYSGAPAAPEGFAPTAVHRRPDAAALAAAAKEAGLSDLEESDEVDEPNTSDSTIMGVSLSPTLLPGEMLDAQAGQEKARPDNTSTFMGKLPSAEEDLAEEPPAVPEAAEELSLEEEEFSFTGDADDGTGEMPPTVYSKSPKVEAAPPPAPPPPPPPASPSPQVELAAAVGASAGAGVAISLEHWSPMQKRSVVRLEGKETWVGRERGTLLFRDDGFLSRSHGRFYRDDQGRLCVEDNGTLNGIFYRIREPWVLDHRDVIQIGRHVMRFELLSNEEEDPRTIEGDPYTRVLGVQGSPPRSRLVKRQDDGFTGMPFFFGTRAYVLGRTSGTHRFTKDDRMSRRHAALNWKDERYYLEDLGSQNGTFIQIRGSRTLDVGDVVKMGEQYFKVLP
jgi:pSer/pThr/pTyr-binding forkhead associated (FHA) protein